MNMPKKKKTNKNHLVVRNEYPRPYQCQLCDSKFDFPSKLKRHIAQMHDWENGDSTDLQQTNEINQIEGFKGFDLHSTQVPIITNQPKKKQPRKQKIVERNTFLLDQNDDQTIKKEKFSMPKKKKTNKNHLVVHNEYPKPFQCQMCDSKFRFPSLLNRHIAQMHDGENGDTTDLQPTQYNEINQIEGFEGFDLHSTQIPVNDDQTIKKEENSMPMDPNT